MCTCNTAPNQIAIGFISPDRATAAKLKISTSSVVGTRVNGLKLISSHSVNPTAVATCDNPSGIVLPSRQVSHPTFILRRSKSPARFRYADCRWCRLPARGTSPAAHHVTSWQGIATWRRAVLPLAVLPFRDGVT